MQQEILDMLLKEEEVSWKTVLYDLVKTEQMDPWNVNITLLTKKYIEVIKGLQEHDLRVSGKVLLAAAILLKIKSSHLVDNDISKLDALINQTDEDMDELEDEFYSEKTTRDKQQFTLIPRNPQPRNRKVSIHDLVSALQRAMASKRKILAKIKPVKFTIPTRSIDIMEAINGMYQKVMYYSKKEKDSLTFTKLLPPRAGKQAKVYTFLPLLHLENHHKVEMWQKGPFDEIHVKLSKNKRK